MKTQDGVEKVILTPAIGYPPKRKKRKVKKNTKGKRKTKSNKGVVMAKKKSVKKSSRFSLKLPASFKIVADTVTVFVVGVSLILVVLLGISAVIVALNVLFSVYQKYGMAV